MYLDDSGDGGFKFGQGSTSHLVMAASIFRDPEHITAAADLIEQCSRHNRQTREFKYSKTKDRVKDCFFRCITPATFDVRTIIIEKRLIYSDHLRSHPAALKSYAIRMLMTKNHGQIRDAKLFIDGQDTRAFGMQDSDYLMRIVNRESPGTLSEIRHVDSSVSRPIQLADMVAGAINRRVRTDRPSSAAHLTTFARRTYQPRGSYWHFRPRPELLTI